MYETIKQLLFQLILYLPEFLANKWIVLKLLIFELVLPSKSGI